MITSTDIRDPSTSKTDATEQDTRTDSDYANCTTPATRSTDAHRGITIRGSGPASGRPLTSSRAVDLRVVRFMIVLEWPSC